MTPVSALGRILELPCSHSVATRSASRLSRKLPLSGQVLTPSCRYDFSSLSSLLVWRRETDEERTREVTAALLHHFRPLLRVYPAPDMGAYSGDA